MMVNNETIHGNGNGITESESEADLSYTIPRCPPTPPLLSQKTSISTHSSSQDIRNKEDKLQSGSEVFSDEQPVSELNSSKFALISDSGICITCEDADAHKCTLTCFMCSKLFHAVCTTAQGDKSGNDTITTRSFFKNFDKMIESDKYRSRPGNFVFICDICMTNHEKSITIRDDNKIDKIDKRVDKLSSSMDEMKKLLTQVINPQIKTSCDGHASCNKINTPVGSKSFAHAVGNSELKPSTLLLKGNDNCDVNIEAVEKVITENSIHVEKSFKSKSGSTVIICPTEKDRTNLKEKLSTNLPTVQISVPPERHPTIAIANLSKSYHEDELLNNILLAHPEISELVNNGEFFKVINMKPHQKDSSKFQATLRVSTKIRKLVESHGDRLYIGPHSFKIFDRFFVKRCNRCQKFNHYMSECKETQFTCGHCSGNHESNTCPNQSIAGSLPCCANCKKSKVSDTHQHTHSAFDRSCPTYIAEQDKLRKSISYYHSKN